MSGNYSYRVKCANRRPRQARTRSQRRSIELLRQLDKLGKEEQDLICRTLAHRDGSWVNAFVAELFDLYLMAANEKSRLWAVACELNFKLRGRRRPSGQAARFLNEHESGKSYQCITLDHDFSSKEAVRSLIRAERKRREALLKWQADAEESRQFLKNRRLRPKTERPTTKSR
jgi:hypothetical protein